MVKNCVDLSAIMLVAALNQRLSLFLKGLDKFLISEYFTINI
jgi:hypothetical protein